MKITPEWARPYWIVMRMRTAVTPAGEMISAATRVWEKSHDDVILAPVTNFVVVVLGNLFRRSTNRQIFNIPTE